MLHNAVLFYLSYLFFCGFHAMLCHVTSQHITLCYVMLCYVMLRYVMLRYVTLRYVTLRYVMLSYVAQCSHILPLLSFFFCGFLFISNHITFVSCLELATCAYHFNELPKAKLAMSSEDPVCEVFFTNLKEHYEKTQVRSHRHSRQRIHNAKIRVVVVSDAQIRDTRIFVEREPEAAKLCDVYVGRMELAHESEGIILNRVSIHYVVSLYLGIVIRPIFVHMFSC